MPRTLHLEMPRPPIRRYVEHLPQATYFKPAGAPLRRLDEVTLSVDELEAVRLKDLEGLEQEEAAARMGVARTTFRRVLVTARAKVADALVHGKAIRIEGGAYLHVGGPMLCADCGEPLEGVDTTRPSELPPPCPRCGGSRWRAGGGGGGRRRQGRT